MVLLGDSTPATVAPLAYTHHTTLEGAVGGMFEELNLSSASIPERQDYCGFVMEVPISCPNFPTT